MKSIKTKEEYMERKLDLARRPSLPATAGVAQAWRQQAMMSDPRLFSSDTGGCLRFSLPADRLSSFIRPITSKELRRLAVAELSDALVPVAR